MDTFFFSLFSIWKRVRFFPFPFFSTNYCLVIIARYTRCWNVEESENYFDSCKYKLESN